jgi:hypothetical protein
MWLNFMSLKDVLEYTNNLFLLKNIYHRILKYFAHEVILAKIFIILIHVLGFKSYSQYCQIFHYIWIQFVVIAHCFYRW